MARAIAATAAALAAFTGLVLAGVFTRLDEWGMDHVMPALNPATPSGGIVHARGLWQPFKLGIPWWQQLVDLYEYPASALVSAAVLAVAVAVILRRGRRFAVPAACWVAAWGAVNAVELFSKHLLDRPPLLWTDGVQHLHVAPFDSSYPSGHTARAVVIAAVVAWTWPRLRRLAGAWLALVPAALVVSAAHVITDTVGGFLLGLLVVLLAHAIMRAWTAWERSSSGSSEASSATRWRWWPTSPGAASSSRRRS